MKKVLVLLLLCSTLLMAACSGNAESGSSGSGNEAAANSIDGAASEETTEASIAPQLPPYDGNGEDFMVLTKMEGDENGRWTAHDIYVESQNGEIVNDAVFERNSNIEEKYNVKIKQNHMAMGGQYQYSMASNITKLVMAGDTTYDVVMPTIQDAAIMARDGMLYDMIQLEHINLENPWWNQQFNEDVNIGGKQFFGNGDICMTFMRASYCVLFNKQLIENYSLENPYELVLNGKWTIDKMLELGKVHAGDTNGDGTITDADNIGIALLNNHIEVFYTASGNKLVEVDDKGNFSFIGDSEYSLNVLEKIYQLYETADSVINFADSKRHSPETQSLGQVEAAAASFEAGRCVFLAGTMNNVPNMRDMETDFGILPYPKYSETQDKYYTYVQTWASGCAAITITCKDIEKSSIILEDMAYQAMEIITPAYYNVALKTKYTRDEESQEILDLIYANRTCDLGNLFNVGKLVSGFTQLVNSHKNTFSSLIAKNEEAINTTLTEISDLYKS